MPDEEKDQPQEKQPTDATEAPEENGSEAGGAPGEGRTGTKKGSTDS
jgi:hypothetical protein